MTTETVLYLLPELIVVAVATGIYLAGAFLPVRGPLWNLLGAVGIVAAAAALAMQDSAQSFAGGPLAADALALYGRWLALAVGLLFVLLTARAEADAPAAELAGSLLMIVAGTMLVSASGDLVLMFLGLELISIPTYVLLYVARRSSAAEESTVKYFFLSILSSAVLLYGLSFLYGVGGSTDLAEIRAAFQARAEAGGGPLAALALVLVFAGLAFRVAAAPFHFYAPDVYQGATNANAGLLSVVPKVAGFIALVRLTLLAMPGLEELGWRMALILAMLTMTVGNLLALWQNNVRRLMAYSSIAHAGYMLIGLAVGFATVGRSTPAGVTGVGAMLFYLALYAAATTGTFAALTWLGRGGRQVDTVDELAGLGRTHPVSGLALAAFLFSLAGVPPLAGFWGKLQLFLSALSVDAGGAGLGEVQGWFVALAVVGVANAAVAAAYYLRIVGAMYFRPAENDAPSSPEGGAGAFAAMALCAGATLLLGVLPGPLLERANLAAEEPRDVSEQPVAVDEANLPRPGARARQTARASAGLWNVEDEPADDAWGNLTGRFTYDGMPPTAETNDLRDAVDARALGIQEVPEESLLVCENGGLANVLIYLRSPHAPIHPDYEAALAQPVTMSFHRLRLQPRIALVRVGQTLVFDNLDDFAHNGHVIPDAGVSPLSAVAPRQCVFETAYNVPRYVGCNHHLWEQSYIAVRDNPYMAVTAADGSFQIANLPAGKWEFQAWHERAGFLVARLEWVQRRFTATIADGEVSDLGDVRLAPELFERK